MIDAVPGIGALLPKYKYAHADLNSAINKFIS